MNANFVHKIRQYIIDVKNNRDESLINEMINDLEFFQENFIDSVNSFSENKDRVVLYEAAAYQDFRLIISGKYAIIQQLRALWSSESYDKIVEILEQYEKLSNDLGRLSQKLAIQGKELQESLK